MPVMDIAIDLNTLTKEKLRELSVGLAEIYGLQMPVVAYANHDNSHDNSGGHPDYHNDSHDNTPSK